VSDSIYGALRRSRSASGSAVQGAQSPPGDKNSRASAAGRDKGISRGKSAASAAAFRMRYSWSRPRPGRRSGGLPPRSSPASAHNARQRLRRLHSRSVTATSAPSSIRDSQQQGEKEEKVSSGRAAGQATGRGGGHAPAHAPARRAARLRSAVETPGQYDHRQPITGDNGDSASSLSVSPGTRIRPNVLPVSAPGFTASARRGRAFRSRRRSRATAAASPPNSRRRRSAGAKNQARSEGSRGPAAAARIAARETG